MGLQLYQPLYIILKPQYNNPMEATRNYSDV